MRLPSKGVRVDDIESLAASTKRTLVVIMWPKDPAILQNHFVSAIILEDNSVLFLVDVVPSVAVIGDGPVITTSHPQNIAICKVQRSADKYIAVKCGRSTCFYRTINI